MIRMVQQFIRRIFSGKKRVTYQIKGIDWQEQIRKIDYEKYLAMKGAGKLPRDVYLTAKTDGIDSFQCLGILCKIFGLSSTEAKEVMMCADRGVSSLSEYQERFIPVLKEFFEQEERDSARNRNIPPKK